MISIKPYAVQYTGDAILLLIRKDETLLKLVEKAAIKTGQVPLETMCITLAVGTYSNRNRMFVMPSMINTMDDILCASKDDKSACFIEVAESSSAKLESIVRALLGADKVETNRKYYLHLSSTQGFANAINHDIWECQKKAI